MKTRLLIIIFLVFVSIPLIYAQEQTVCSFEKDVPLSENYFVNDPTVVEFLKLYPEAKYMTDNAWEEPLPPQTYAQYLFKDLHLVFQILEYNPENTKECYFINGYKLFNQYTPNLNVLNFQKDPNVIIELLDTIKPRLRGGPQNIDAIQLERFTLDYSIPAPLKQMKLGIKLGHIICDKDKIPVWNIHYKPACVYHDSEYELIKRGWAKLRLMLPAGPDPIKELDWMGRNVMSMMLEGTFSYISTPVETLDEKRAAIWEYSEQYHSGEQYLEYAIISHQYHYNVGDKVQFDLLEWGNYQDCWNLKLRIIDRHDESVYEDNSVRYCLEPDGTSGIFHSYSMGKQFDEFVCGKSGYYRIEVSNENIFFPTILQNFACLESKSENTLRPDDRLGVRHSAGYTTVYITLSIWDEYYQWEKDRGTEHDAMPPILFDDSNINPIVFDLLNEMWKFEDYDVSKYDDNLFTKIIQKDYSVSNHDGIHDWLELESEKQFGKSKDGFSNHFEYRDNIYIVTMLTVD